MRYAQQFPKPHLIAISAGSLVLVALLALTSSEDVEATRTALPLIIEQPVVTPTANSVVQAPIDAQENRPTALHPPLPAVSQEPEASLPEPPPPEKWLTVQISKGDNLTTLFKKAGLGANDLYPLLNSIKPTGALNTLKPGEELAFLIQDESLQKVRHIRSALQSTIVSRTEQGYDVEEIVRTPEATQLFSHGEIDDSLFLAGQRAGLSEKLTMELAAIFGWDVDFALDIRKGDHFSLIYEELSLDGKVIGEGNIIAAEFSNQGNLFRAIRYTDSKDNSNYFTPEGKSMRKAFLRTPVDFARISSRFNPNRKHPIFKTNRPHRGVDYAAPTGTPIKSAGDGKVIHAGRKGGYGNAVIVQHGQRYSTLYAHMSKLKRGIRTGSRVKQGETIGYVGSTGYATGPHLHYEFRLNGAHRNPLTVPLPQANPLPRKEMARFEPLASDLIDQLETYQQTRLASN